MKRIKPYIIIITIFNLLYLATMLLPEEVLFFGSESSVSNPYWKNKTAEQELIFGLLLPITLIVITVLESRLNHKYVLIFCWLKSIATILITLIATGLIYHIGFDDTILNIHYHYRGAPVVLISLIAIFIYSGGIIIANGFKKIPWNTI
ncbi:MAG: hypothetical protein NXI20_24805 [bacterium]|nr:hypothetical protein [bacterium]